MTKEDPQEFRYRLTQGSLYAVFFGTSEDEVKRKFKDRMANYGPSRPIVVQRLKD